MSTHAAEDDCAVVPETSGKNLKNEPGTTVRKILFSSHESLQTYIATLELYKPADCRGKHGKDNKRGRNNKEKQQND